MTMSETEIDHPVVETAELAGAAVEIEARSPEPSTAELPPAKRVTKRRSTRKTAAKKLAAASQVAQESSTPRPRRRRRSAVAIPALLDPVLTPEDAEGRVEFIVQALPAWPDPPAAPKTRGKRKAKKESPKPNVEPAASVPWSTVVAIAAAMVVVFVVGALMVR